ncbi:MAG: hypothetical protein ABL984_09305, partial [Pyrinomonadaceae bacterium]
LPAASGRKFYLSSIRRILMMPAERDSDNFGYIQDRHEILEFSESGGCFTNSTGRFCIEE